MSRIVLVELDGVKLKLTCNEALLAKPFTDAILTPFLGAFNKKRGVDLTLSLQVCFALTSFLFFCFFIFTSTAFNQQY